MVKGVKHISSNGGKKVYYDVITGKMAHGRSWVPEWHAWHHFDKVTGRG